MELDKVGFTKSLCNGYKGFSRTSLQDKVTVVSCCLKNYRTNINPVETIYYDTREMVKRFNQYVDHRWALSLVTCGFHHESGRT